MQAHLQLMASKRALEQPSIREGSMKMSAADREKHKAEIRKFAYDLGMQLKKWCELF